VRAAGGSAAGGAGPAPSGPGPLARAGRFLASNFLPVGLVAATAAAVACQGPGLVFARIGLQRFTTAGIFIISGLSMRGGETAEATRAVGAIAYGLAAILLLTPLAAFLVLRMPVQPEALVLGLAVFLCMPTTLSSGISLTTLARGNTALALLLTVASNMLGVLSIPFVLSVVLGAGMGVRIPPWPMLLSLIRSVLLPVVLGVALRTFVPAVARACDANKARLSTLSTCLLITVPYTQVSTAVSKGISPGLVPLVQITAIAVAVHVVYLVTNAGALAALRVGGRDAEKARGVRRAVILVASQKTLPIAITVLQRMGAYLGESAGLSVIPCISAHLAQIIVDSFLVSHWNRQDALRASSAEGPGGPSKAV